MSRAFSVAPPPLMLDDLEINILSCHRSWQGSKLIIQEHEHPNYELSLMEVGEMTSFCDVSVVTCKAGDDNLFFMPPATLHHRTFGLDEVNINLSLVFTISGHNSERKFIGATLAALAADRGYCLKLTPQLNNLMQEMKRQADTDMTLNASVIRHLLYSFIAIFFQQNFPELFDAPSRARLLDRFDFENNRVTVMKRALINAINTKHTLKFFENTFGMSSRHLNRIFKQETGMTITQYQVKQRIDHARNLLIGTNIPIAEISTTLGFVSPVHFSCFFQKHQGCSPSQFRNINKNESKWQ